MQRVNYNSIFIGDINMNLLDGNVLHVQNYINLMANYGFVALLNSPTRFCSVSDYCLDHIFVKSRNINLLLNCAMFNINLTDCYILGLAILLVNNVLVLD